MAGLLTKAASSSAHDGNDMPFEQAVSNIAHAYIRDAAPMLLDHEIGFQLLDRSDDNKRAIGVMGFKLGSQTLYAPVFFLKGQIKGNELLYIKDEDMFVPLDEKWVMYLLNRKPVSLGEGVNKNTSSSGVRWPNLDQLRQSPVKYGSWVDGFLPVYAALRTKGAEMLKAARYAPFSLPELLKRAGHGSVTRLLVTAQAYPWLEGQLERYHGPDFFKRAVAACPPRAAAKPLIIKQAADKDSPKNRVQIFTYSTLRTSILPHDLTEKEVEDLTRDGVVIRDNREPEKADEQVSKAYDVAASWKMWNPTETGLYDVLVNGGELEKCLVVVNPYNDTKIAAAAVVVPLDSRAWAAANPVNVWVNKQYDHAEWDKWYDGLSSVTSLDSGSSTRLILSSTHTGTQPFRVNHRIGGVDGRETFEIEFKYASSCDLDARSEVWHDDSGNPRSPFHDDPSGTWSSRSCRLAILPHKTGKFRHPGDGLSAPSGFKVLTLKDGVQSFLGSSMIDDEADKKPKFTLGSQSDVNWLMMRKSANLKLWTNREEYGLNGQRMSKTAALISLVKDYGLREAVSRDMLKAAEVAAARNGGDGAKQYWIKLALPWDRDEGPDAPPFPEPRESADNMMGQGNFTTQMSQQENIPVPAFQQAPNTAPYEMQPLDQGTMSSINRAAQSGQKEVFDTSVMDGLLRVGHIDREIEECLDGMLPGVDKFGRMLFLLYSHGEQFAERYGKEDLRELEDGLRDAFAKSGEIILFLKTREIEGNPQAARLRFDMDD